MRAFVLSTALALAAAGVAVAQDNIVQGAVDAIKWDPAPPVLPKGGEMAVLSGNPGKSSLFTVRLKLPAGYRTPPHQHPHSEPVTVISGELHFGMGTKLDEKGAQKLRPGGFVELPANVDHFAFALVDTVIQISTERPFGIKYTNPADDPSKRPWGEATPPCSTPGRSIGWLEVYKPSSGPPRDVTTLHRRKSGRRLIFSRNERTYP